MRYLPEADVGVPCKMTIRSGSDVQQPSEPGSLYLQDKSGLRASRDCYKIGSDFYDTLDSIAVLKCDEKSQLLCLMLLILAL